MQKEDFDNLSDVQRKDLVSSLFDEAAKNARLGELSNPHKSDVKKCPRCGSTSFGAFRGCIGEGIGMCFECNSCGDITAFPNHWYESVGWGEIRY